MAIEIGDMIQEWTPDEGEADPMQAYIQVAATLDGTPITLGVVVGVPDSDKGSCQASGSGVRPYLRTLWADASDWQDVPSDRREEAEEAMSAATRRLWAAAIAARAAS